MPGDVIEFPGVNDPHAVLYRCLDCNWHDIIVIGTRRVDRHVCFVASKTYSPELLWLLEKVKHYLLREAE